MGNIAGDDSRNSDPCRSKSTENILFIAIKVHQYFAVFFKKLLRRI
jgi:hypothetical protein